MALTESWLKANHGKERNKVEEVSDRDAMSVRISAKGKIVFQLRYRFNGKPHRLDIGTYPNISLKDARIKNHEYRTLLDEGKNPKIEVMLSRTKYAEEKTIKELFDIWFENHAQVKLAPHSASGIKRSFELHVFPMIGKMPGNRVRLQDWLEILDPLSREIPSIANSILAYGKQMLKWHVIRQNIDMNVISDLFAKGDLGIEKQKTTRVLDDEELKLVLEGLMFSRMNLKNKIFVELCLIYGCRNGELRRAQKTDFDFNKMTWTVPIEHNKVGKKTARPIVRPILPATEVLIKTAMSLNKTNHFILAKKDEVTKPQFALHLPDTLMQWVSRHKTIYMKMWSMHDLRRTARTNFSALATREVAEIMVGHTLPSIQGTYDYYDYLDEQKKAYQLWIDKLDLLKQEILLTKGV